MAHYFQFLLLIFSSIKLLANASLKVENYRVQESLGPIGNFEEGGVRFKMESPNQIGNGQQMTAEQKRREKIAKEQAKVDFINWNSNGLWKASLFLPFALMEDEEKKILFGTIPANLADNLNKKEENGSTGLFNSTYVNMLLKKVERGKNHERTRRNVINREFDARKMWPECAKIIQQITQQGACGSCWAVVASAVLSDRICIWRLKKFEGMLAKWTNAVEIGKRIGLTMADWNYFGELVEQIWSNAKLILLANNFKEAENVGENKLNEEEKVELKENWYKLLMNRWIENNSMQINNLKDKLKAFELWYREMNLDKKIKMQMQNRWCQNIYCRRKTTFDRELPLLSIQGLNHFDFESNWLRRIISEDYKRILHFVWMEPGQKWERQLEKAEMEILEKFRNKKMHGKFDGDWGQPSQQLNEEEFICILQEIRAGQWNFELGMNYPRAKLVLEKRMEIARVNLKHWQILEEYLLNKGRHAWKREMLKMFEEEANKPKNIVSVFHILTCAHQNEQDKCEAGATLNSAFQYARSNGMVSGLQNDAGPNSGCKPYKISPSFNLHPQNPANLDCQKKCSNQPWGNEAPGKIGKRNEIWLPREYLIGMGIQEADIERMIMAEIVENGPVGATIMKANSIEYYKEGIYSRTNPILTKDENDRINEDLTKSEWVHAVRLIGWGEENGIKFWIAANSWGKNWGEKGFFRIIRGQNDIGIEEHVVFPVLN